MEAKKTILIVDDEPNIRALLKDSLVSEGFEVSQAESGESCLEMARSRGYDLILLDVQMPGLNGLNVLRRLREEGLEIPIMFLTGSALEVTEIEAALALDPSDFVTKGASTRELVARIRWVLRRSHPRKIT